MRKRRSKGKGTVFRRADGMWVAGIELPAHDGKRRQRRVYSKDKATVLRKLEMVKAQAARDAHQAGHTEVEIAAALGVNRMTIRNWLGK